LPYLNQPLPPKTFTKPNLHHHPTKSIKVNKVKANMASRRMGKEPVSPSRGPPSKRQATPRNHGIEFNTPEQWSRYKSLLSKPLHPSRYPDYYSMNKLGIRDNAYRLYLQRVMSCRIWGRKEVGSTRTDELFMLWAMLSNNPVNTCYYLLDYLASIGVKSNNRAEIVVGGIITFIARKFGVGEDNGMNPIEGNNRLTIETLISMVLLSLIRQLT